MKKLLAFVLVMVLCAACYNSETHKNDSETSTQSEVPYVYTKQILLENQCYTYGQISSIRHFTYNGHDYIQFHICGTHSGGDGVVHDPDCRCLKNDEGGEH